MGVVVILAGLKFSGSPRISGVSDIRILKITIIINIGRVSLIMNVGKNFVLSRLVSNPEGLDDP